MPNVMDFALSMLGKNPNIGNNPNAQAMLSAIRSNDQQAGEQMARNICKSYGVSEQEAISQARRFFGL